MPGISAYQFCFLQFYQIHGLDLVNSVDFFRVFYVLVSGFSGGSVIKNLPANAEVGSLPGSKRSFGKENGKLLQYFCLGNPMGGGAWRAPVCGVIKESDMTYQLKSQQMCRMISSAYCENYSSTFPIWIPFISSLIAMARILELCW